MLYGISAVLDQALDQLPFSNDAVLDALDVHAQDAGTRPPALALDTPSSTR
jgi:hypothetical protein